VAQKQLKTPLCNFANRSSLTRASRGLSAIVELLVCSFEGFNIVVDLFTATYFSAVFKIVFVTFRILANYYNVLLSTN